MLLNKANLNLANITSKEASRYQLNGILVEENCTVATDGHRLMVIGAVRDINAADFPLVNSQPALDKFPPFILSRATALEIAKSLPSKERIPALNCAAVVRVPNGEAEKRATLVTTDLDTHRVFDSRVGEGQFPNWRAILPKGKKPISAISFDPDLMIGVLQQMKASGVKQVALRVFDSSSAMRLDATLESGQPVLGILMPMRGEAEKLEDWPEPYNFEGPYVAAAASPAEPDVVIGDEEGDETNDVEDETLSDETVPEDAAPETIVAEPETAVAVAAVQSECTTCVIPDEEAPAGEKTVIRRLVHCAPCDGSGDDEAGERCENCEGTGVATIEEEVPTVEIGEKPMSTETDRIDPVCGLELDETDRNTPQTLVGPPHEKTFYFCSLECKQDFDEAPEQYL